MTFSRFLLGEGMVGQERAGKLASLVKSFLDFHFIVGIQYTLDRLSLKSKLYSKFTVGYKGPTRSHRLSTVRKISSIFGKYNNYVLKGVCWVCYSIVGLGKLVTLYLCIYH